MDLNDITLVKILCVDQEDFISRTTNAIQL